MAILGTTSLTGCLYIEGFLGGQDPTTLGGYRSIFENASAPTSWVKDTSYSTNGIALRVVTGIITSRTNLSFAQTFTNRSIGLDVSLAASAVTLGPISGGVTIVQDVIRTTPLTSSANVADLPTHTHPFSRNVAQPGLQAAAPPGINANSDAAVALQSGNAGQSGQHTHTIVFNQHTHPSPDIHTHTITGQHDHTVPGPASQESFSVIYRDVIIAEKTIKP